MYFKSKLKHLLKSRSKPFGDSLHLSEGGNHGLFKLKPQMFDFHLLDSLHLQTKLNVCFTLQARENQ